MNSENKTVEFFTYKNGETPFTRWMDSLDRRTQAKVDQAQDKIRRGLLTAKNSKYVGAGAFEFKIDFGPGYRLYFGQADSKIILLLGGDKSTQDKDILKAKEYWADYERRENANDQ